MDHRLFWQNIPPPPSIPVPILDPPSSQADGSEEEVNGKDLLESIETLGWLNIVLKSPTMFPIGVPPSGTFVDKSVRVKSPKKYKTSICGCCILIGCLFLGMLILIIVGFITTMALASGGNEFELSNFLLQPSSPAQHAAAYHLNFDMENHEVISTKVYKISVYGVLRDNSTLPSSTLPGMVIFNGGNSDHFCINRHANMSLSIPVSFTESPLQQGSVKSVCANNSSSSLTVQWRISILCRHMLGLLSKVDFNATTLMTCPTN